MDNKFLLRLKGKKAPKAVVEVQDPTLVQAMDNVPGTATMVESVRDERASALVVAKGAKCFAVNGAQLAPTTTDEFLGRSKVAGTSAWVNAQYIFPASDKYTPVVSLLNPHSKWVLRLSGCDLLSSKDIIEFSLIIRVGTTNIASKDVFARRKANQFCKTFEIDFSDSPKDVIHIEEGDALSVQLVCKDSSASATIYNGKTVLTLLERVVDGNDIKSSLMTFEEAAIKIDALEHEKTGVIIRRW